MANTHKKRCSKSLIVREIQIKTTVRYHLTPARMATSSKSTNDKGFFLYTPLPTLVCSFIDDNDCDMCEAISVGDFNLHFSDD